MDRGFGIVKWFSDEKFFGFIIPDNGQREVFIHGKQLAASGLKTLSEGQRVSYDLKEFKGKTQAENVKIENVRT